MNVHQRKVIRDAAVAALLPNKTRAGARVISTRVMPWRPKDLPGVAIYTRDEDVVPESAKSAPRELERHPNLVIEGVVRVDVDNIDDELDAFALEIEKAIAADDTLNGTASDCWVSRTEFDFEGGGDQGVASVRVIYAVTYFAFAPDSDDQGPLDDLKTIDAKYNLAGGQTAANQAEDTLEDLDE